MMQYAKYVVPAISSYANTRARNNYRRYQMKGNRTMFDSFAESLPKAVKGLFFLVLVVFLVKGMRGINDIFDFITNPFDIFDTDKIKKEKAQKEIEAKKEREEIASQYVSLSKTTITPETARQLSYKIYRQFMKVFNWGNYSVVSDVLSRCQNEYDYDLLFKQFGLKKYHSLKSSKSGLRGLKEWLNFELSQKERQKINLQFLNDTRYRLSD